MFILGSLISLIIVGSTVALIVGVPVPEVLFWLTIIGILMALACLYSPGRLGSIGTQSANRKPRTRRRRSRRPPPPLFSRISFRVLASVWFAHLLRFPFHYGYA